MGDPSLTVNGTLTAEIVSFSSRDGMAFFGLADGKMVMFR